MGRSQETFSKKEREKKRAKKRQEKLAKKEERKANATGGSLDEMMAYVDVNGNIVDTPPDESEKEVIKAENIEIGVPKASERVNHLEKKGRLVFWNDEKGYGFIKDLSSDNKYFVHQTECQDEIKVHDKVVFELEKGPKGMSAVRVSLSTGG